MNARPDCHVLVVGPARPAWSWQQSCCPGHRAVPGGIEDYFHEINTASTDGDRHRIGERYGIRVVPE